MKGRDLTKSWILAERNKQNKQINPWKAQKQLQHPTVLGRTFITAAVIDAVTDLTARLSRTILVTAVGQKISKYL